MLTRSALLAFILISVSVSGIGAVQATVAADRQITPSYRPGVTAAVRVSDAALVFTGQIVAAEPNGDAREQAAAALLALERELAKADSDVSRIARLNAYVDSDEGIRDVEGVVAARFGGTPPAMTIVRTPLKKKGARVAFDAVALSSRKPGVVETVSPSTAILPAGGKIFISGQAERGSDVASAVKATMAGLHRSVAHLGLKKTDIVQVKAFLTPFGDHAVALREITASFDGAPAPPVVMMEWVSTLFTEIEIVVSARALPTKSDEPITYAWLSWLTKSPRYCHVTHVSPGTPLIFISAIDGGDANDSRTQMKTIFERLGSVLFDAGSSYRHLAKATYYLADPTARALLGDIRGVYFDPTRPPAASALNMNGIGYPRRAAMVDMIAVPAK